MPELLSVLLAEDVLQSTSARPTLYNVFNDVYAYRFPAFVGRMCVVNTWFESDSQGGRWVDRTVLLSPDRRQTLAESEAVFALNSLGLHTQVHVFSDVVLPKPGTYWIQVMLGPEMKAEVPLFAVKLETEGKDG